MLIKNSIIIKNFKLILYSIIISAFLLRVILAIYYYFEGPLKFASEDAIKFHEIAIIFHDYGFTWDYFKTPILPSIGWIYSYLLSLVYSVTQPSILVGNLLSCFFWLFTAIVLNLIMLDINTKKVNQIITILFFCFLPSSIVLSIFTLREIYQVFCFTISIYFYLKFYKYKKKEDFALLIVATFFLALFHKTLFLISIIIIFFAILSYLKIETRSYKFFTIVGIFIGFTFMSNLFFFHYEFLNEINIMRSNHPIGRATYGLETLGKDGTLIINLFFSIILYFLKPFLTDVANLGDFIYIIENVLRLIIIYKIITNIFSKNKLIQNVDINTSIFFICISLEFLWAIGTVNWGTALRHHYVVAPVLYTIYFNFSYEKNKK